MSMALRFQSVVACNVYVSVGKPRHAGFLTKLLAQAQQQCKKIRSQKGGAISIVHAFADEPYDRSSFHLAGNADHVAAVASSVASQAVTGLSELALVKEEPGAGEVSRHPFVGLVDHVAVMPLENGADLDNREEHERGDGEFVPPNASGWAARCIGNALTKLGVKVYFYGNADENRISLANVRRERTSFFKSGGLEESNKKGNGLDQFGVATVGAPLTFVENWNVRLASNCSKKMAQSLTRTLRERDGGLLGVEGLTLPYSNGRYEIACNLLRPDVGSADAIQGKVDEWVSLQLAETPFTDKRQLVDKGYRVGTTAEQCLDVLSRLDESEVIDMEVMKQFQGYLRGN